MEIIMKCSSEVKVSILPWKPSTMSIQRARELSRFKWISKDLYIVYKQDDYLIAKAFKFNIIIYYSSEGNSQVKYMC